ncbi:hypothetical protein JTE90_013548 [Oedothorax gibbosus]|uniref:Uncharacterized protein n=1 Tax=Oedothorax gibbosus TaxID=931172 RepID=A0AAV6UD67_9ARAC|nr:hypothetical protein JTE90_013548 [Oedothorax gibbosus]
MVNWLEKFPGLKTVSNFTYCYEMPYWTRVRRNVNANRYDIEDFQMVRDLWDMHKGFRRIDMPEHKITFQRKFASPKRLTTLCQKLLEDSRLLGHLPEHVSNRLKGR